MTNNKPLVGVTLLFAGKDGDAFEALLHSFAIPSCSLRELKKVVAKIVPVTDTARAAKLPWQYIGIEDIFCVVGPLQEGAMLGRTTLWDTEQSHKAQSMISGPEEPIERTNPAGDCKPAWAIAEAVYLVRSKASDGAVAIIANVLLDWANDEELDRTALSVTSSADVIGSICRCGTESIGDLEFLGIQAIRHVPEDIKTGGAMEKQSNRFSTLEEISRLVMPEEELNRFVNITSLTD